MDKLISTPASYKTEHIYELKHPLKSHRKKVILPDYSDKLAEFFGIMMGDSGINNLWQSNISLNSVADASYSKYIFKLCKELFGIEPAVRKRKTRNTLIISLASTSIVDFLVDNGLPRGNKLENGLRIPLWILSRRSYKKFCVRGLVDTDGCMYIHRHTCNGIKYTNLGLAFSSYSPILIEQVAKILAEFGIMPHIRKRGTDVYIYKVGSIIKYLEIFWTSNDRIMSVYKKWRDARAV